MQREKGSDAGTDGGKRPPRLKVRVQITRQPPTHCQQCSVNPTMNRCQPE